MNTLDKQYTDLLQDILDNGVTKRDRTGTGTISVFGRQVRHKMSEGFPLLTTKKMSFKTITTELLWFLCGDTDIRFLWENNCSIWDGDWYKKYKTTCFEPYTLKEVKQKVKEGNYNFHDSMFDMGPVYGKQWRKWETDDTDAPRYEHWKKDIDQIANLINDLKTNPDSRRLLVSAWNVGELDKMTLPPCHYGFQVYTRELSAKERWDWYGKNGGPMGETKLVALMVYENEEDNSHIHSWLKTWAPNVPTRAISLMWNQRSVDTFLGLPFNIASYGLLLEIIAKEVNMVTDELIGNLGDTHLYLNHIEQAKEQIGRELSLEERIRMYALKEGQTYEEFVTNWDTEEQWLEDLSDTTVPKRTREPYTLPTLNIKLHFNNEPSFVPEHFLVDDFEIVNYKSHSPIKAPLSN